MKHKKRRRKKVVNDCDPGDAAENTTGKELKFAAIEIIKSEIMHEGKGLLSLATGAEESKKDVVQIGSAQRSSTDSSDDLSIETSKISVNSNSRTQHHHIHARNNNSGTTSSGGSGGGSGEDSSSDEPPRPPSTLSIPKLQIRLHHHHHHALPPKKYRFKDDNYNSNGNNGLSPHSKLRSPSSPSNKNTNFSGSIIELSNGCKESSGVVVDRDDVDMNQDEIDDLSGPKGHGSTFFTSGENSDSELGVDGDGDENMLDNKQDSLHRKVFECDLCNMKFSNGANMRRHRLRHTGVKPYECRVCKKRFFRKDHLAEHITTHSKLLPFRCPICNKGFQRQIAMRAHFQNEHVGNSQEIIKACPLCSYKAGSMKSLRVHFYSRHGIDLDNPMPNSPSLNLNSSSSNNNGSSSPGPCMNGEYSELAQALGFEDREKSSDSSCIPSHFLVPQIEISSNSPFTSNFNYTADSSYGLAQDERHNNSNGESSSPLTVSPQSDSSSNVPSSSGLIVVKREIMDDERDSPEQSNHNLDETKLGSSDLTEDIQEGPEDLSSNSATNKKLVNLSQKCKTSILKISPLKSLLCEDWKKDMILNSSCSQNGNGTKSTANGSSRSSIIPSSHSNSLNQAHEGDGISSSNGSSENSPNSSEQQSSSLYGRRGLVVQSSSSSHQCVYCGIIFPDKTLYFLHKGCHSDSSPWRCNICGESCIDRYDFNSHLLSKSHQ